MIRTFFVAIGCVLGWMTVAHAVTLKVGATSWPPGYGNPYGSIPQAASHTRSTIYDALTQIGPDGHLAPALALSWRAVDANTWRFSLRPDVRFSNGEPFDAAAVKAAIEWLKSPAAAGQLMTSEVRNIDAARVVDDLTVDLITKTTDAVLPKRLTLVMMVAPKAWAELGVDGFTQTPIGTGPYVLQDWGLSSGKTVITANRDSWRVVKQIDRVELYPLREGVRRIQALSGGQVDITQGIGPDDIEILRDQGFVVFVDQLQQIMALLLRNVGNEGQALHDVRVRQALNYAVDKNAIADIILAGTAQPVGQGAIAGATGYNPDIKPYPYDPAKAKALLADAGYADGLKLEARVQSAVSAEYPTIHQKVAADLAAVGVQLDLRPIMAQEWVRMYSSGDWDGADIISGTWNSASYGDTIRALETFSCTKPGAFFCDPPTDDLIAASGVELDEAKRDVLLQQAMARLHDQAASIFLVNLTLIVAHSPRLHNVAVSRTGFLFEDMTLDE